MRHQSLRFVPFFLALPLTTVALSACDSESIPADTSTPASVDNSDGGVDRDGSTAFVAPAPSEDITRDILSTKLEIDISALTGKATIDVASSSKTGLSFEVGDLQIKRVTLGTNTLEHTLEHTIVDLSVAGGALAKRRLDIGVPVSADAATIVIEYTFSAKAAFDGWLPESQVSFLWPYFCSNLFPCHSSPSDGLTFELAVTGVPAGQTAVFPASIPFDAPSYMPAIAVGNFAYKELGTTAKGTHVGYYALPGEAGGGVVAATSKLVDIFGWLETTIGAYRFGDKVAAVDAPWGDGAYGGMEHHPYFHVSSDAFGDENVHAHEAAHGWFGNGVRIKCWEDFVLSEGTSTYLAARATEAVRGVDAGKAVWAQYRDDLNTVVAEGDTAAWPQTCNKIDLLVDPIWSLIPYMKGAFFYRAVAKQITPEKLDAILAKFYATWQGKAASMSDMIALIAEEGAIDPTPLVDKYLKGTGNPEL